MLRVAKVPLIVILAVISACADPIFIPGISNNPADTNYYKKLQGVLQRGGSTCMPTVGYEMALYSDTYGKTSGAGATKLLPAGKSQDDDIAAIKALMGWAPGEAVTDVAGRRAMESIYRSEVDLSKLEVPPKPAAYPNGWAQLRENTQPGIWKRDTQFSKGDVVLATGDDGKAHVYIALQDGNSGSTRPRWPGQRDGTVVDGTTKWKEMGPEPRSWTSKDIRLRINDGLPIMLGAGALSGDPWAAEKQYKKGDVIVATAGGTEHFYLALQDGKSAASAPVWPSGGGTVADGTMRWQEIGLSTSSAVGHVVYAFGYEQMNIGQANEQFFVYLFDPLAAGPAADASRPKLWEINPATLAILSAVEATDPTKMYSTGDGSYPGRKLQMMITGNSVAEPSTLALLAAAIAFVVRTLVHQRRYRAQHGA